jgi:Fic family protein
MKIPMPPPKFDFNQVDKKSLLIPGRLRPVTAKGEYLHWDKLRHLSPPHLLSSEQWWLIIKLARKTLYKQPPFQDKHGKPFVLATTDNILHKLHSIDRSTGNAIQSPSSILNNQMKDTYLVQSLIEESITSSQLEGASTTRKVAKEMLRTQRKPRDLSEKMIFNNYQALQFVRDIKNESLTVEMILELHNILTKDTLDDPKTSGKIRVSDDIHIWDNQEQILHTPPHAKELEERISKLCNFANETADKGDFFIHPIIRAILLHFMLAYDHPFVDGNGRTARALFYWCMAHQGYSLMEYISISEIIKRAPSQYARAYLYSETDENDLTYFVIHQLDVILKAINALYKHIDEQRNELIETEKLLRANQALLNKLNYRQIALIKHALKHPNIHYQIEGHRQSHNITYDTARTDLLKLAKFGLLSKQKTGKAFTFIAPSDLKKQIENLTTPVDNNLNFK